MKNILLLIVIIALSLCKSGAQNIWRVNRAATGANTGLDWPNAFKDLHGALNTAQAGDEIWVAAGTYYPDMASDRNRKFALPSNVRLLGGFAGNEASKNQRDPVLRPAVLDGNVGNPWDSTDNSFNILYLAYPDTGTVVDGFVFRHGFASSDTSFNNTAPSSSGAAVYILAGDSVAAPVFANCTFRDNAAKGNGGAVYVKAWGAKHCNPLFRHCAFLNNKAGRNGGAVHWSGGSPSDRGKEFHHCTFLDNESGSYAGGVYYSQYTGRNSVDFVGCRFERNKAKLWAACIYHVFSNIEKVAVEIDSCKFISNPKPQMDGLIHLDLGFTEADSVEYLISANSFLNNFGNANNGVLFILDGTAYANKFGINRIVNNVFESNVVRLLFNTIASSSIKNNKFLRNTNLSNDLLLMQIDMRSDVEVSCNIFEGNNRASLLGLLYVKNHSQKKFFFDNAINGNGLVPTSSNTKLLRLPDTAPNYFKWEYDIPNNLFRNFQIQVPTNSSGNPYAIYTAHLTNNIFLNCKDQNGNPALPFPRYGDTSYLSHNWLDIPCADLPPLQKCLSGNLFNLDPMFVDTAAGDYRLRPCSPLVNAGTNTAVSPGDTDLDGRLRILGGTVDIGPYEMPGIALAAAPDVRGSCAGGTAGAATFSVMDACVPVSYVWSAASGGSGAGAGLSASGLAPGGYTFTLTDAKGFADTLALTVPEAAPPSLAPVAMPVVCGDTLGGSATATVAGAAPPMAFAWAGGSTDSLLQNLPPGQYALTVTDANGCSNTLTINVERTGNLGILPDVSPISCFGETDGSITVAPADGRPPFVFQWDGGPSAPTWAMLGAGVYEGTVTDAFGCTAAWTFPLAAPGQLLATALVADASGPASADGGIAVTQIEGGTPPYTAAWSNGAGGLTNAALLPGEYFLTLTDGQGCIFRDTFLVDFTIGTSGAAARAFKFSVNPNPAGGTAFAKFELAENQALSLVVTDLLGRPLRTALAGTRLAAGAHSQRLDLAGLPAGVYLVQLRGAAATGVVKVVKE